MNQNRHADGYGSVEVPDLVNVDYMEACPLFDGGYVKSAENSPLTGLGDKESLDSTPELYYSRYTIFIGEKLSQKFISSPAVEMKCEERKPATRVPRVSVSGRVETHMRAAFRARFSNNCILFSERR